MSTGGRVPKCWRVRWTAPGGRPGVATFNDVWSARSFARSGDWSSEVRDLHVVAVYPATKPRPAAVAEGDECWAVFDAEGCAGAYLYEEEARAWATRWDGTHPADAPHRVVKMVPASDLERVEGERDEARSLLTRLVHTLHSVPLHGRAFGAREEARAWLEDDFEAKGGTDATP